MANTHTEFWLQLLSIPNSRKETYQFWNGYLAWKLPESIKHRIWDVGNPPFREYAEGNSLALKDEEKKQLDHLARKHNGHPPFPEERDDGIDEYMDFSEIKFLGKSLYRLFFIGVNFNNSRIVNNPYFKDTIFVYPANFSNSSLHGRISFEGVKFLDDVDFSEVTLDSTRNIDFSGAEFWGETRFFKAKFLHDANFRDTKFEYSTYFDNAIFRSNAIFSGAIFSQSTDNDNKPSSWNFFTGVEFECGAHFDDAVFIRPIDFSSSIFHYLASFTCTKFCNKTNFHQVEFKHEADFQSAVFECPANFNNASFNAVTSFYQAAFNQPPKFFETKLHEDTNFGNIDWARAELSYIPNKGIKTWFTKAPKKHATDPKDHEITNLDSAIHAWDRLALMMSKREKHFQRHKFYRLRMRAQRWKDGLCLSSMMNWLFDKSSDYGWSIQHALFWWFGHWFIMSIILFCGALPSSSKSETLSVFWDCVITSFANAHAFLGLASEGGYLYKFKHNLVDTSGIGWILSMVGVVEAIIGPILLFLVLLTIRNRFRLG